MRLALCCLFAASLMAGCASSGTRPPAITPPTPEVATGQQVRPVELSPALGPRPGLPPPRALPQRQTGALAAEAWSPDLAAALARHRAAPTPESELGLAQAYVRTGILDKAHELFSNVTRADPTLGDAWEGLARVWRAWGLPGLGLGDAYRAVSAAPRSAAAHNTLGTILEVLGNGAAARERFARAEQLDPAAAYAANNLCYSWLMDGEPEAASRECRKALSIDPAFRAAEHNLALASAMAGDAAGAAEIFDAVGGEGVAQYNLGVVFFARHRYAAAAEAFERAAELQPSLVLARARAHQARARATGAIGNEGGHERR